MATAPLKPPRKTVVSLRFPTLIGKRTTFWASLATTKYGFTASNPYAGVRDRAISIPPSNSRPQKKRLGLPAALFSYQVAYGSLATQSGDVVLGDFFDAELHATTRVHIQHLHVHVITFLEHIGDVLNAAIRDLRDVHQSILTGQQVDECAKINDPLDLTVIDPADFDLGRNLHNPVHRRIGGFLVGCVYAHCTVVINIDGRTSLFGDGTDGCTTLTNYITDLLRINFHGDHLRRFLGQFGTRSRDHLVHFTQDMETGLMGFFQGYFHDFLGDTLDLDIHLQGGDTVCGTGHFEVHIAQVILVTQDIGQNSELVAFFHQSHGDTGYRSLQGNTAIHQGQTRTAHTGHGAGTVGFGNFRYHADHIGEVILVWQHGLHTPAGQTAVADLATPGSGHPTGFTDGVRREVIVQHEGFLALPFQGIRDQRIAAGAQGSGHQSLGFTPGEQRGTMGIGQHTHFNLDGPDRIVVTPVDTGLAFNDIGTDHFFLQLLEQADHFVFRRAFNTFFRRHELGYRSRLDLIQASITLLLFMDAIGFAHSTTELGFQLFVQSGVFFRRLPVPLLGASLGRKFLDRLDGNLIFLVSIQHATQHLVFAQLGCFRLHHQHGFFGTGHHHVQLGVGQLAVTGVQQITLLFGETNPGSGQRAVEGYARQFQGCGRPDNGSNIRIIVLVGGHDGTDDLYFVHETFGKKRTDGAVDQAGSQGFLLGGTSLTTEVSARNAAHRIAFFLIVNRQRKEILTGLGFLLGNHCGQDHGIVHGHEYRTTSLTRNTSCFQSNVRLTELKRFSYRFHGNSLHDWVPRST